MWGFVLALYLILVFHPDHSKPFMTVQPDYADQPAAAVRSHGALTFTGKL